jgi:phosphoribosylformylglycinamidine cyclo-ligase
VDILLAPHRSYLRAVRPLLEAGVVKGMAHITGGGITENLPRVLPAGCAGEIETSVWTVPPIFRFLQERGRIATDEMFRAFNMGIGLIAVVAPEDADRTIEMLDRSGNAPHRLGTVVGGNGVRYV